MTPQTLVCLNHPSPLGTLTLVSSPIGICGIYFHDQRHFKGSAGWQHVTQHAQLDRAARQLDEYFAGQRKHFELPLDLQAGGTAFQQAVWKELLNIGFGSTSSYGRHAALIARPSAVRAVGGAIGRNPISIVVPCHRVLGSSGALTGYDGGLDRKKFLLELEGVL